MPRKMNPTAIKVKTDEPASPKDIPPKKPPQSIRLSPKDPALVQPLEPQGKSKSGVWEYKFQVRFIRWGTRSRLVFTNWALIGFRGAQSNDPSAFQWTRWRER